MKNKIIAIIASTLNLALTILFFINYMKFVNSFSGLSKIANIDNTIKWHYHLISILSFIVSIGVLDMLVWGLVSIIYAERVSLLIKNIIMIASAGGAISIFINGTNSKLDIASKTFLIFFAIILSIVSLLFLAFIIKDIFQNKI